MAAAARLRPAVLLALLSFFRAATCARRDVLELGDAEFDYLATEHETMLVKFYAPWCGHCKKLAPEFEKAATRLKGTVQLAKVDCTSSVDTCARFGVSGYPTLKIFRYGRDSAPYDGPRTADGIFHYMKKQAGPDSVHLKTEDDLRSFTSHHDASIVGVFPGGRGSGRSEFLKAAALLRENFRFAHTDDLSVVEKHKITSECVCLFRPPRLFSVFEDGVVVFSGQLTISSLRRFIRDHIYGLCPHMTLENKEHLRVHDLLTAYYDLDYQHNPQGSNYWRNRVMRVAAQHRGRGLFFSVANHRDFLPDLQADFGLAAPPAAELPFISIKTTLGHKYSMREEFTRDGGSLQRFLSDFFAGRLKRFVKSEPLPEKNSAPVRVVVADSFDDIINDPLKDVLIQFYSPSCQHCKKLQPTYTQLASTLSAEPNLVIAKMNAVDNDVPLSYDVHGYPSIFLAAAGRKDEPIRYEGGRELKDFLKFLKREARLTSSSWKDEL